MYLLCDARSTRILARESTYELLAIAAIRRVVANHDLIGRIGNFQTGFHFVVLIEDHNSCNEVRLVVLLPFLLAAGIVIIGKAEVVPF